VMNLIRDRVRIDMAIKHFIYIGAFVVLGILLQQLVHALIELVVIRLLIADFSRYGLGLRWRDWYVIHAIGAVVLFIGGVVFGYWQGKHWWQVLYVEKRRPRWPRRFFT